MPTSYYLTQIRNGVMCTKNFHMNTDFCLFKGMKVFAKVVSLLGCGDFMVRGYELLAYYGRAKRVSVN